MRWRLGVAWAAGFLAGVSSPRWLEPGLRAVRDRLARVGRDDAADWATVWACAEPADDAVYQVTDQEWSPDLKTRTIWRWVQVGTTTDAPRTP